MLLRRSQAQTLSLIHISPYSNAGYAPQEPERARKLLLHQRETAKLAGLVAQKGLTVVPVRLYLKRGKIKVELAVGRGKKLHDHRESLKKRAEERDLARELA